MAYEKRELKYKLKAYLEEKISNGAHKGAFCYYGNLLDKECETLVSAGCAGPSKKFSKDSIVRYASNTKLIGGLILAKCIEENIVTLNDQVSKYLPEFNKNLQYYDDNNVVQTTDGNEILLSHLVSMSTGLGYYFFYWGNLYPIFGLLLTGDPPKPFSKANALRNEKLKEYLDQTGQFTDWGFDTRIYNHLKSGKKMPSFKKYVEALTSVPLLFKPGTNSTRESVYGLDMDVLGACLNVAVKAKGHKNLYSYFKKKFMEPMHIDDIYQIGNEDRIKQLVNDKLIDTAFRRPLNNLQPDGTEFAPDPSAEYLEKKPGEIVWSTQYQDGFRYNELLYKLSGPDHFEYDPYQGYLGGGFFGSLKSYAKILGLICNKGKYKGKRIIGEGALALVTQPTIPEYKSFAVAKLNNKEVSDFQSDQASKAAEGTLSYGYNEHWAMGSVGGNTAFVDALYMRPYSNKNTLRWGGYYGASYIVDTESGNFVYIGVEEDGGSQKFDDPLVWAGEVFLWVNSTPSCDSR